MCVYVFRVGGPKCEEGQEGVQERERERQREVLGVQSVNGKGGGKNEGSK